MLLTPGAAGRDPHLRAALVNGPDARRPGRAARLHGASPWHLVALVGCFVLAAYAVWREASVDDDDAWVAELPALVRAAWHGDSGEVSRLLAGSAELQTSSDGWTALHAAAVQGHADVVAILLAAGADVDALDEYGSTPLLNAAGPSNAASVALLLEAGADLHYRDSLYGQTPIRRAAEWGKAEVLRPLLAAGADPNEWSPTDYTPLMTAAEAGSLTCVEVLLAAGARLDIISDGETAASFAVRHGHEDVANRLRRAPDDA